MCAHSTDMRCSWDVNVNCFSRPIRGALSPFVAPFAAEPAESMPIPCFDVPAFGSGQGGCTRIGALRPLHVTVLLSSSSYQKITNIRINTIPSPTAIRVNRVGSITHPAACCKHLYVGGVTNELSLKTHLKISEIVKIAQNIKRVQYDFQKSGEPESGRKQVWIKDGHSGGLLKVARPYRRTWNLQF